MKNWDINPITGDYVMVGGAPTQTKSLKIPAYIRLKVKRGLWLYAPDAQYGSDYHLIKHQTNNNIIETTGISALQPLVDDGRASNITVETTDARRGGVALKTRIVDAQGEPEDIIFRPIGA